MSPRTSFSAHSAPSQETSERSSERVSRPVPTSSGPLTIEYRKVADLRSSPANPRKHSVEQIRWIGASITAFGFVVPVLVDGADRIVAGHGRVLAAQHTGMADVPVIRLDHLSQAQIKALMLADNRLTEIAAWDDRLLAEQLRELASLNLDFDLEATGFTMGEIDLRIASLETSAGDEPPDVLPAEPGQRVSRQGDLWLLDEHRLLCADARDAAIFERLMAGDAAAMVFADPPYNVRIDGHVSGNGAIHHREFAMAAGEMSRTAFTEFLGTVCRRLTENSAAGSIHYICMDWRHMGELIEAGERWYGALKNLCVWTKANAGMGSFYRSQHELVFVFKHGEAASRNNVQLGRFGRNRSNVWPYAGGPGFARGSEADLAALHPTVKPVALVADAIRDASARRDIILDPFLGSGTTLIAAERTGRRCYGIEIDPIYVDTAIRRWQALTGRQAIHADDQRSFLALEAEGRR